VRNFRTEAGIGINGDLASSALFSYDALETRGRRRPVVTSIRDEDSLTTERKRRILSATTQDLDRNFEIAAWAIRKHLDYVTHSTFRAMTGDRVFDEELEAFVATLQARERFDSARRHPMRRFVRLAEACRVRDGDVGALKLTRAPYRGQLQGIEGDRIFMPRNAIPRGDDQKQWVHGIKVGAAGSAIAYAVADREHNSSRRKLRRIVPANSMLFHSFYNRFDQVRGISPLIAALNRWRDTYESFDYAHAKVKLSQLFGLEVYREGEGALFGDASTAPTADLDGDGVKESAHEINITGGGPFIADLDPGDRIGVIESKTPSGETVNFLKLAIHVALKCLDIPYSFLDESFTNFYGSRGGVIQYLRSCRTKIEDIQDFQNGWARWRLGIAVADGEFQLPSGREFDFLRWEFVPVGIPWWDPVKEATGAGMSIAMGISSPQLEARLVGTNFEDNVRATAKAIAYAKELGIDLVYAKSSAFAPAITTQSEG